MSVYCLLGGEKGRGAGGGLAVNDPNSNGTLKCGGGLCSHKLLKYVPLGFSHARACMNCMECCIIQELINFFSFLFSFSFSFSFFFLFSLFFSFFVFFFSFFFFFFLFPILVVDMAHAERAPLE